MNNCTLTGTECCKYLGVILDSKMSWVQHITYAKSKVSKGIGITRSLVLGISSRVDTKSCDLRANILVACKVTPAIWLNLSDSRNILIIHFGLLLKERTLDSIGHDLLKKYNAICLLWMICYISLLTNIFTQWILIGA